MKPLVIIPHDEFVLKTETLRAGLGPEGAMLICGNSNLYWLTGRVFSGYVFIPAKGPLVIFVKRPVGLEGDFVEYIRKPEQIAETVGLNTPGALHLELDTLAYSAVLRLAAIFPQAKIENASAAIRSARAVKTPREIGLMKISGEKQTRVYRLVPRLYRPGMTDIELQIEIERQSRLEGCLGEFRISGDSMEIYMGNVLAGENADNPTPYDFAMGGAGLDPSLPVGADGSVIRPGDAVMVDVNGNYTGYMTDMTRTFAATTLSPLAAKAHQCSVDICAALAAAGKPGVEAKALYTLSENMAADAGL